MILNLPPSVHLYVATGPVDMRKSFDGLSALVEHELRRDPLSGHLFCFFNRVRDRVKILWFDHGGYALYYKRLERGRFRVPDASPDGVVTLRAGELALILEGIELRGARHRKAWTPERKQRVA